MSGKADRRFPARIDPLDLGQVDLISLLIAVPIKQRESAEDRGVTDTLD